MSSCGGGSLPIIVSETTLWFTTHREQSSLIGKPKEIKQRKCFHFSSKSIKEDIKQVATDRDSHLHLSVTVFLGLVVKWAIGTLEHTATNSNKKAASASAGQQREVSL